MNNIKTNARLLRLNQTAAETILWNQLRGKRFFGYKFRRQHVFGSYIVDFVCISLRLIIEVDGPDHAERKEYDALRTQFLNSIGYKVLRFTNYDVFNNIDKVLEQIHLNHKPLPLNL